MKYIPWNVCVHWIGTVNKYIKPKKDYILQNNAQKITKLQIKWEWIISISNRMIVLILYK